MWTVKNKLEGGLYNTAEEFAEDVKLVFSNSMIYNPPESPVHVDALSLNYKFHQDFYLEHGQD